MKQLGATLFLLVFLAACSGPATRTNTASFTPQEIQYQSSKANRLFEDIYDQWIAASPMSQAYLGKKTNYDQWDDLSEANKLKQHKTAQEQLVSLNKLNPASLDTQTRLSLALLKDRIKKSLESFKFRHHGYNLSHMGGLHTQIPTFLINIHRIDNIEDANNYIKRLQAAKPLIKQLLVNLKTSEALGYHLPDFEYPRLITSTQATISGYPFQKIAPKAPLWKDFESKIDKLDIYLDSKKVLKKRAKKAFKKSFLPAYRSLLIHLKKQQKAKLHAGYINPDYYKLLLSHYSTQDNTAESLHQLGLTEVMRLQAEIQALLPELNQHKHTNLKTIQELFEYTRNSPELYLTDNKKNRALFLDKSRTLIEQLSGKLPQYFAVLPDSKLSVEAVEAYRESSTPIAFYQRPSPDNSRPGRFYSNLSLIEEFPLHRLPALTYHESIPGHHFEISLAQQLKKLPSFRRNTGYSAFSEGWGLYAEYLAKEMGGYTGAWEEYGRLSFELWRAVRLVLDTGLNHYKWDKQQALEYRLKNTPFTRKASVNAIERYLVMPGQAISYKVGMIEILKLRRKAELTLGRFFDIREFHQQILQNGPLPLPILKQQVENWIQNHQRPDYHQWMPDALLPQKTPKKAQP